jgi:ABC-type transporter Mla maintaining outer membrane lipid asymmetry ATPase subunit MlaF
MNRINFEDNFEIYLFTYPNETASSSKLNEFLAFLKFHKIGHPYKFSFVSTTASLIPEMTLNQNIMIDFTPNSLTESKDVQFQDFLKADKRQALNALYNTLELPHEMPAHSNAQMKKVCSLIKSLLYEGEFLFFEEPEIDLEPEALGLFIEALKERVQDRQINVFIYSKSPHMWMSHSHKSVQRMADYNFLVTPIVKDLDWKKERENFYAPIPGPEEMGELRFIYPNQTKKKAA